MNDGTAHTVTIGADSGDPRTVSATVVTVERREESSIFGGSNVGLYAQLDVR